MKKISKFIRSLYNCVMNPNNAKIISWGEGGLGFRIINQKDFKNLLYKELKIRNLSTFIRQVNLYGFKTKRNIDNLKEYFNENFVENQKNKLNSIERNCSKETKQTSFNEYSVQSIKYENELLYLELQKNKVQQALMLKLIQINFDIQKQIQKQIANLIQDCIKCSKANEKKYYEDVMVLFLNLGIGFNTGSLNFITECFQEIYSNVSSANLSPLPFQKLQENSNYNLNL